MQDLSTKIDLCSHETDLQNETTICNPAIIKINNVSNLVAVNIATVV